MTNSTITQLSSPPSLQPTADSGPVVQHRQSERVRLQSAKATNEDFRSLVQDLTDRERQREHKERQREHRERRREHKERQREHRERQREHKERQREHTLLVASGEIRSRIAQALNDLHAPHVSKQAFSRLKNARLGYLPSSLATWGTYHEVPFPTLDNISDDDFQLYHLKGANIQDRGLADDMDSMWDAVPEVSRSLMINMWVAHPQRRNDISHVTPTISEGEQLVDADSNLTPDEVALAKNVIRTAVDQYGVHLFKNA